MIFEPRWKSYIVKTNQPIFTPLQCKMVIEAGRENLKKMQKLELIQRYKSVLDTKQELHILVGYHLKKCQRMYKDIEKL